MSMARALPSVAACVVATFAASFSNAMDLSGGVGFGGMLAGSRPRLAISPHAGVSWRTEGGFLFAVNATLGILPAVDQFGVGANGQISAALGYGWKGGSFSAGPELLIYSMPACGAERCARLKGVSPGARAQMDLYFLGPLGLSLSVSVAWLSGSVVLPSGVAVSGLAGPVLRWGG